MARYSNFVEYLNEHYKDIVIGDLIPFLKEQFKEVNIDGEIICFDDCEINDVTINGVTFTKSEIDKVEFECHFYADYLMVSNNCFPPYLLEAPHNYFTCYFKGSFSKGFKLADKEIELIEEEEFQENLTNSVVPVIPKEKMDRYASKFLKYFCPEALETPTKLDLKKMLNDKGVYYYKAPMGDQIYGKIYFANDTALVYDSKNNVIEAEVSKGTILINYDIASQRKVASVRNTIVHEAVHWFFHRNYFELRQLLDNTLTCAVCYKGGKDENSEIAWMEKQARALAPRILMPKKQFLAKFKEFTKEIDEEAKLYGWNLIEKWHEMVVRLADFFGTSWQSVKYRLRDLNKHKADGVFNYVDGRYIDEFTFKANYLKDHQTFVIDRNSFIRLLQVDAEVMNAFKEHKLLFINNMVVVNNPKYVDNKNQRLTDYALNNVHECCLVFEVCSEFDIPSRCNGEQYFMFSAANNNSRTHATINRNVLTEILGKVCEDSIHYEKHKKNIPNDFYEALNYHYKKSGFTQEMLADESDINVKYIREYLKGTKRPKEIEVIRMALAMRLSFPYLNGLLKSLDMMIISFGSENEALLTCLSVFGRRIGMEEVYIALMESGMGNLLQLSEKYIEAHNLTEYSEF